MPFWEEMKVVEAQCFVSLKNPSQLKLAKLSLSSLEISGLWSWYRGQGLSPALCWLLFTAVSKPNLTPKGEMERAGVPLEPYWPSL